MNLKKFGPLCGRSLKIRAPLRARRICILSLGVFTYSTVHLKKFGASLTTTASDGTRVDGTKAGRPPPLQGRFSPTPYSTISRGYPFYGPNR